MTRRKDDPTYPNSYFNSFTERNREFDRELDRDFKRVTGLIVGAWIVGGLISLGLLGVAVWAVVQLVQWLVTK